MNVFLFLLVAALLPTTLVAGALLVTGRRRTPFIVCAAVVSALFLLSLPAGVYQGAAGIERIRDKPLPLKLVVAPAAAPFNTGGWSVAVIHDAIAPKFSTSGNQNVPKAIRTFHIYLPIWLLQTALAVWTGYHLIRQRRIRLAYGAGAAGVRGVNLQLLAAAALFLVNSLAGLGWPWWER